MTLAARHGAADAPEGGSGNTARDRSPLLLTIPPSPFDAPRIRLEIFRVFAASPKIPATTAAIRDRPSRHPGCSRSLPTKADPLTDNTDTTGDDAPFDEAAALADIMNYSPDRARTPTLNGGSASSDGGVSPRLRTAGAGMAFSLTMLSPEQAGDIPQRLARIADPVARKQAEAEMVEAAMTAHANASNVKRGHPTGNAVDREVAAISVQILDLEAESQSNVAKLSAVARYDQVTDPTTGHPTPVPVPLLNDAARARLEDRQRQIVQAILELEGPGGKHRIDRAAAEELEKARAAHEQARIVREADKMARTMVADRQIKALAEAKAKSLGGLL